MPLYQPKPLDRRELFIALALLVVVVAGAFGLIFASSDGSADGNSAAQVAEEKKIVENACASSATFQGLKRLVFEQAGRQRTLERVNFDILANGAVVRMEQPVVRARDEKLDLTRCSGRFILELPPGAETAFGGERRLVADAVYEVQAAADGSGPVYRMVGTGPLVSRLAAFDMEGRRLAAAPPSALPGTMPVESDIAAVPEPEFAPPVPAPSEPERTSANPSFNCRYARTQGEVMVCGSERLAAQDRRMASLYGSAMDDADRGTRRLLERTADQFLAYRDRCRDESCVAEAYEGRMRQIRDIMADQY